MDLGLGKYFFNTDEEIKEAAAKKATPTGEVPANKPSFTKPVEVNPTSFTVPVSQNPSFTPMRQTPENEEIVAGVIENYRQGFESLNQAGYDFYEFYQTIKTTGVENEQSYQMAFNMAKIMEATITKDKLLNQANFYTDEIKKVHTQNNAKGISKLADVMKQKESESKTLSSEVTSLEGQLRLIQEQLIDRQTKLNDIDGIYQTKIDEVNSKINANDIAKDYLLGSIESVKNGLTNIKQ